MKVRAPEQEELVKYQAAFERNLRRARELTKGTDATVEVVSHVRVGAHGVCWWKCEPPHESSGTNELGEEVS